jgi:hypothetical protein
MKMISSSMFEVMAGWWTGASTGRTEKATRWKGWEDISHFFGASSKLNCLTDLAVKVKREEIK